MDIKYMLDALPMAPPHSLVESVILDHPDGFGGPALMLYNREAVTLRPPLKQEMGPEDFEERERASRRTWGAYCTCTACGSNWYSGWFDGKVIMYEGDDGMTYEGVPESLDDPGLIVVCDGESAIRCPMCEEPVTAVRRSDLRNGRTWQLMACALENVGPYTALIFYLVRRHVDAWGFVEEDGAPLYAAVIDEDGGLVMFSAAKPTPNGSMAAGGAWRHQKTLTDPFQIAYYCWGCCGNRSVNGVMVRSVPPQLGQTGEKTGLAEYIRAGGHWPVQYMLFWRENPHIENLVKAGWTRAISQQIDRQCDQAISRRESGMFNGYPNKPLLYPDELEFLASWECAKPFAQLHMSRDGFRRLKPWDCDALNLWMGLWEMGTAAPGDELEVDRLLARYGIANLQTWAGMVSDGWDDINMWEIDRYLERQHRRFGLCYTDGFRLYLDYREMADTLMDDNLNAAALWPVNLRNAHDGAANGLVAGSDQKYIAGFRQTYQKWAGLEWTDGELCIRLPRTNGDLIREGRVLNHCVGRYGKDHVAGRLILFVRHARRPERSWFTLNIDVTGSTPRQVQLHGYGNEYAHGLRLQIPQKVTDFVERWKKEVLAPVFREVRAKEKPKGKTKKEKAA